MFRDFAAVWSGNALLRLEKLLYAYVYVESA